MPPAPSTSMRVHVVGAVRKPGVYVVPHRARAIDAMRRAGGPTGEADLEAINLADILKDGEQIRIPKLSEREAPRPARAPRTRHKTTRRKTAKSAGRAGRYPSAAAIAPRPAPPAPSVPSAPATNTPTTAEPAPRPVNLNTATVEELAALPEIGTTLGERIVEYRQSHGPFERPAQILNVPGFGLRLYLSLRPYLHVQDPE